MNKKLTVMAVVAATLTLFCGSAFAVKGPQGVAHTVHNLSADTPYISSGSKSKYEDEVCIFCHTPHGGNLEGPLWNRVTDDGVYNLRAAGYFTHYNSATLSPYMIGLSAKRNLSDESLMCMGCHDGTIATNRVINVSNRTVSDPGHTAANLIESASGENVENYIYEQFFVPGSRIGASPERLQVWDYSGGHLEDDHPVSIDYDAAQISKGATSLRDISVVRTKGIRFFPDNGSGTRLECSSCHDPHVNYGQFFGRPGYQDAAYTQYAPFLSTTNQGSYLCLACHIK